MRKNYQFKLLMLLSCLLASLSFTVRAADLVGDIGYRAVNAQIKPYPSGAGLVYVSDEKEDNHQWYSQYKSFKGVSSGPVNLYAKPNAGYNFVGFTKAKADGTVSNSLDDYLTKGSPQLYSTGESYSDSITAAKNVPSSIQEICYAVFSRVTVKTEKESIGKVEISKVVNDVGDYVTIKADNYYHDYGDDYDDYYYGDDIDDYSYDYYKFEKWTLNGQTVSTDPTYSFKVTQQAEYVAHYKGISESEYNAYPNSAPKISVGKIESGDMKDWYRAFAFGLNCGLHHNVSVVVWASPSMLVAIRLASVSFNDISSTKEKQNFPISLHMSNGIILSGVCSYEKNDLLYTAVDGYIDFSLLGVGDAEYPPYNNIREHNRYVSNLLMNYNLTKIVVDGKEILIDQTKWGSKYTFEAMFKALAEKSGNYEAFDFSKSSVSAASNSGTTSTTSRAPSSSSTSSSTSSYSSSSSPSSYGSSTTESSSSSSYDYNYEWHKRFWGFSFGYVQKQWVASDDEDREKMGFWEDSKLIHGVQAGVRFEPYARFGLGLNTGLFYEFYYSKSKTMLVDGYNVYGELMEHALYMPLHLCYRLRLGDFQIFAFGGAGADFGVANSMKLKFDGSNEVGYDASNIYETEDSPDWKRFNASYEFGGGLRYKAMQATFTMSKGFLDMSSSGSYKMRQNKPMMVTLGFMF